MIFFFLQVKNNQGEIDTVLKNVSDKLSEVATNLQNALGPEGQKQAKDIKAKLDKGLKEAVAQAEKLTKAIEPEAASKYSTVPFLVLFLSVFDE